MRKTTARVVLADLLEMMTAEELERIMIPIMINGKKSFVFDANDLISIIEVG